MDYFSQNESVHQNEAASKWVCASFLHEFDLFEKEPVAGTRFNMNGFVFNSFWHKGKRKKFGL